MPLPDYDATRVGAIVKDLRGAYNKAQSAFDGWISATMGQGDPAYQNASNASWHIEIAFLKLLTAIGVLHLDGLRSLVVADMTTAKSSPDGLAESEPGPEEPYARWLSRYWQYLGALEILGGAEIVRATLYPITDKELFGSPPQSEAQVHLRIEGVLRCVFTDLKHKPALTKPIKNFQPDTGLPSLRTLIEYKFLTTHDGVSKIADEVLADTRGYTSKEWDSFLYVIYETNRLKPERESLGLLRACDVPSNTSVIVLSGEPATKYVSENRGKRSSPSNRPKVVASAKKNARI